MKLRCYPVVGATLATLLCLVSGWVVYQRFTTSAIVPSAIDLPSADSELPKAAPASPATQPTNQPTLAPSAKPVPVPTAAQPVEALPDKRVGTASIRSGVLRVGNPTSYPVRVALLPKQEVKQGSGKTESAIAQPDEPSSYEVPAHWDFAPEEGGANGLLVSLPDRTLKLKRGDVLVAFAQDGSGRYWGPYVVDETAMPTWNPKAVEWQLILQP
ncbi:hypothetical protein H6F86_09760 [Phormidium sp. FACHB-592]|uniref:Uncharacterized protein n=1 Tax=Stenomitos frigidus AS-A4 TaxID=2933935 RepID=A0ABV0KS19_9CYAN|nr:hypothetical protein [Phormidium sp. FACHB-592]MBD2074172.1 hypothetical protein [Phormidium sp. FACHB-592]